MRASCSILLTTLPLLIALGEPATPVPTALPLVQDTVLRADFGGIGPARVGMTIPELASLTGGSVATEDWNPPDCDYAHLSSLPALSLMIWGDTIVRIDIWQVDVATSRGVSLGSTEAEVLEAYPTARIEPHPYDGPEWHYMVVDDPEDESLGMIFETDGQAVHSYRVGFRRAVALIEGCS